jgi:hypothetical protein
LHAWEILHDIEDVAGQGRVDRALCIPEGTVLSTLDDVARTGLAAIVTSTLVPCGSCYLQRESSNGPGRAAESNVCISLRLEAG